MDISQASGIAEYPCELGHLYFFVYSSESGLITSNLESAMTITF